VFWYKPRFYAAGEGEIKLCHPLVWNHARERTDENKVNELELLTCYSGDEN
jgi:hypothetical protein